MKKIQLASAALAMTATLAMADGHGKTIRMGTEGAYPPYNFINDAGEVDGTWPIWRIHPSALHGQEVLIQTVVKDSKGNQVQAQTTQTVWDEREWD